MWPIFIKLWWIRTENKFNTIFQFFVLKLIIKGNWKSALQIFRYETSYKWTYLIGGKKVGEKWVNFLQVTKFFPDEIFPRLSFSRPVFFPDFYSPDKEFISIFFFFNYYYYYYFFLFVCKIYYYHVFFWCTLFIVVEQSNFNKNFEMRVKARNWKK